jgi:hypothetical protein
MTKVIHIKNAPPGWQQNPDYVYIGRPGKGLSGLFGNPISVGKKCPVCGKVHTGPGDTLPCFEDWLRLHMGMVPAFHEAVLGLRGKILVCFCKDRPSKPCHGDIYVKVLTEEFSANSAE